ncbi:terminase family protein [Sinorhizobium terangae]|nr:terminase family protein [Sinorhizobium terangae]WFU49498.1 terminase family protein [Sinorhizobium terangae]
MPNRSTGPAAAMAGASARPRDLRALLKEQAVLMAELDRRRRTNILAGYRPYAKQREFHDAGAAVRERLFMAGNQLGKTLAGAAEAAMHLTGRYRTGGGAGGSTDRSYCWRARNPTS